MEDLIGASVLLCLIAFISILQQRTYAESSVSIQKKAMTDLHGFLHKSDLSDDAPLNRESR